MRSGRSLWQLNFVGPISVRGLMCGAIGSGVWVISLSGRLAAVRGRGSRATGVGPSGRIIRLSNPLAAVRRRDSCATGIKGDGETHPFLSPNDEFANYERWDKGNLDLTEKKKPEMLELEYARSALKNGLKLESELGVNPYKFGMVGSTDSHTGLAAVEEDNFFGKTSSAERARTARRTRSSSHRAAL